MTETEKEVEQQQQSEAMEAAFAAVRDPESARADAAASAQDSNDAGDAQTDEGAGTESHDDPPVFAGLTEAEIRSLLERTSRLSALEEQLSKAHGKIGELNRTVQQLAESRPAPSASAAHQPEYDDETDLAELEDLFPNFRNVVESRARKIAQEVVQQLPPSQAESIDMGQVQQTIALSVLDATRPGWRDTVQSGDFQSWIAGQPEDVQQVYATTWDAAVFTGILDRFGSTKRAAGRSKDRLEQAIVPDSRSAVARHAPTELDAMQAGFDAVRNPRYSMMRN